MTNEQYERWKDFALRMASVCYKTSRRPSGEWILEVVTEFFDQFDECDIPCIVSWDHSAPYPVGDEYAGHRPPCISDIMQEFLYEYEPSAPDCKYCSGSATYVPQREPGTDISRMVNDEDGSWGCNCPDGHVSRYDASQCREWLDKHDTLCNCDEVKILFWEQWDEQFGGPIRCCIRAGLDCASAPSAGVVGFNAGDIRAMYPEGVPEWLFPPGERLHYWLSDEMNGTFEELADTAGVVL